MAKDKNSFVLYCDLIHTVRKLPKEDAGELFIHILEYVNDLNPETENPLVDIAFEPIKQSLKRDLKKYEHRAERARENGKKGGRPKNPQKPTKTQSVISKPKKPDSVSVSVSDSVSVSIPSIEDFVAYGLSICEDVSLDHLRAKYHVWKNNGWVNGNGKEIKNWKNSLVNTIPYLPKQQKEEVDPMVSFMMKHSEENG